MNRSRIWIPAMLATGFLMVDPLPTAGQTPVAASALHNDV